MAVSTMAEEAEAIRALRLTIAMHQLLVLNHLAQRLLRHENQHRTRWIHLLTISKIHLLTNQHKKKLA
jgi:hypothetical protein